MELFGSSHTSGVGRDDSYISEVEVGLVSKVVQVDQIGFQIVDWDSWSKETLFFK